MMEWFEFSVLHGVDHFFVYTFKGTDDALEAGLATKTHFDVLEGRLKNYNYYNN